MTETKEQDPTHCDRCKASLERGWSERWVDDKRQETICFDCDNAEQIESYKRTRIITTKLLTRAAIESVREEYGKQTPLSPDARTVLRDVNASCQRLQEEVKRLEKLVWFGGLQERVRAATHRGFRADIHDMVVLVYSMAGRTMITVESADDSHSISVITAEESTEPCMGIQGIRATEEQAITLLAECMKAWDEPGVEMFRRDDKVGII